MGKRRKKKRVVLQFREQPHFKGCSFERRVLGHASLSGDSVSCALKSCFCLAYVAVLLTVDVSSMTCSAYKQEMRSYGEGWSRNVV